MWCKWCHKLFGSDESCLRHIRTRHKRKERYGCRECSQRFRTLCDFRLHLPVHFSSFYYLLNGNEIISKQKVLKKNGEKRENFGNHIKQEERIKLDKVEKLDKLSDLLRMHDDRNDPKQLVTSSSSEHVEKADSEHQSIAADNDSEFIEISSDEDTGERAMPTDLICQFCHGHRFSIFDLGHHILNDHASTLSGKGEQCYGCYHWFKGGITLYKHMRQCNFIENAVLKKKH